MACTITVSRGPQHTWIVRNLVFDWLCDVIIQETSGDTDLHHALVIAQNSAGMSLDRIASRDRSLAGRMYLALKSAAAKIAEGETNIPYFGFGDDPDKEKTSIQEHFNNLFSLLTQAGSKWDLEDR